MCCVLCYFFFFKQKTAYEMRISDWSSDVCSSDLYVEANGYLAPHGIASDYSGGRIERIDIATGAVEILYKSGDNGVVLRGPNDIMFDAHGGFWFTDHGKVDYEKRCHDVEIGRAACRERVCQYV